MANVPRDIAELLLTVATDKTERLVVLGADEDRCMRRRGNRGFFNARQLALETVAAGTHEGDTRVTVKLARLLTPPATSVAWAVMP